ncbi:MAG: AarF/ABC1/UbiB kinase family protein [Deltaproteobacteria bacterium]|jgi:ubiquinone biosynthesis protein|nr:AarF/ABC1/UbiB kinase family protein [Deltaproteobacteria bacterium]
MNWEFLINENTLAWLVPDIYAHYRRPLLHSLTLFLEGLPETRREDILAEQAALPVGATVLDRLVRLARSCPVLHKLGQTLARDRNLSAELRKGLQKLESLSPSVPMEAVKQVLKDELGPLDRLGITLLPRALAEASVAVVVPFRFSSGKLPLNGVFKVLKPGIQERMEVELALLEQVGSFLDRRCDDLGIPQLDYRDSFEQVREKLLNEVRLDREQSNLSSARRFYRGDPRVVVPELFDFCTPKVTAMERVTGRKVTRGRGDLEKKAMARLVIETLIARPIFSLDGQAPFHGDPHAGNLFRVKDGRLAVLDWSLVGLLGEKERVSMMQTILGGMGFSPERIIDALSRLSIAPPGDPPALMAAVNKAIARIQNGQFPGFTWLKGLLDDVVRTAGVRFGAELMLFRRAIHMVEGVVTDLEGEAGLVDRVFLSEFGLNFSAEWPRRFWTPPGSRDFSTRISNTDLAGLMMSFPWRAFGFWLDRGAASCL